MIPLWTLKSCINAKESRKSRFLSCATQVGDTASDRTLLGLAASLSASSSSDVTSPDSDPESESEELLSEYVSQLIERVLSTDHSLKA